jgi:hypothetical protein
MLTPPQKVTLKTAILADSGANAFYAIGDLTGLAGYLNAPASPTFWVWRTDVSRADIYTKQNDLPIAGAQTGFWNWTTYKNQGATEQNAWVQMFMGDVADFSRDNLRLGVSAIFTGSAPATAQKDHVLAVGRRAATFAEKVLASGAGSTASPAVMGFEGDVTTQDLVGL